MDRRSRYYGQSTFLDPPYDRLSDLFPVDAIDQRFENFRHYEVKLVSVFLIVFVSIIIANTAIFSRA
jgi:hypothetical protein